jgi:hypothetical protein
MILLLSGTGLREKGNATAAGAQTGRRPRGRDQWGIPFEQTPPAARLGSDLTALQCDEGRPFVSGKRKFILEGEGTGLESRL